MRRAVCLLTCASCAMSLLCVVGLALAWLGETNAFVLPDATDVRIDKLSPIGQRVVYQLPPNRTLNDLYRHLEQYGWVRDPDAEQALRRDRTEERSGVFAVLWRHCWFGLLSEVAVVGAAQTQGRLVEVRLARCFAIVPWTRCL